ncbi:PDDEXK-like family protein [Janthinobacterium sp. 13]|uniref:PDDEXK-like family protein n=1 Tax=Janthinobacterium sp. 13 TaxID=2035211 RepID=UPI0015D47689|nr:PD-(D/E)XK nuclease family protein [Janthinobacterium sp. 13]
MKKHSDLLQLVALLRRSVPNTARFNLFLALRGAGDEVRLHSRFIGALLDPAYHVLGYELLIDFLREIEVPITGPESFSLLGLKVQVEHMGIDLLITNADRQAVLIENKIFAGDQEKQLRRYYDELLARNFGPIFVRYLTLDGHEASEDSLSGLNKELQDKGYQCISYAKHIRGWLESGERMATRDIPVRESISQYLAVINSLTGSDQEETYMNGLVETLLIGENMRLARDVRAAYMHGLVELQDRLWTDIEAALKDVDSEITEYPGNYSLNVLVERKSTIENFYRSGARNNKYYGLYFSPPDFPLVSIGIEIEASLYSVVICDAAQHPVGYRQAKKILADADIHGGHTVNAPFWRWCPGQYNLQDPDEMTLAMLCDEKKRREFARTCAEDVIELWRLFVNIK